jgi:hypothetical protein
MAYSKAKLKSSGGKASPCFTPLSKFKQETLPLVVMKMCVARVETLYVFLVSEPDVSE